jgi:hypothetical protein
MVTKRRDLKTKDLSFPEPDVVISSSNPMPTIPLAAVWSFLKETRGEVTWRTERIIQTLKITAGEAADVLAVLQIQGYIQREQSEWMTTAAGEEVSGSKMPRYTSDRVDKILTEIGSRIKTVNGDSRAPFKVRQAVAFGDFLSKSSRVQAPDVGVELANRRRNNQAISKSQVLAFLKDLKGKTALVHVEPYEHWMSQRSHRKIF